MIIRMKAKIVELCQRVNDTLDCLGGKPSTMKSNKSSLDQSVVTARMQTISRAERDERHIRKA